MKNVKPKVVNCNFAFKCPQKWLGMLETTDENIRFCTVCNKDVFFAKDEESLAELISKKRCVAVFHQDDFNQLNAIRSNSESDIQLNNLPDFNRERPDFRMVTPGLPATPEMLERFTSVQESKNVKPKSNPRQLLIGALIGLVFLFVAGVIITLIVLKYFLK